MKMKYKILLQIIFLIILMGCSSGANKNLDRLNVKSSNPVIIEQSYHNENGDIIKYFSKIEIKHEKP